MRLLGDGSRRPPVSATNPPPNRQHLAAISTGTLDELDGPFRDWQARLVSAFGPTTRTSAGPFDDRYPESAWEVPGATVRHWVIDGHAPDHALSITPR